MCIYRNVLLPDRAKCVVLVYALVVVYTMLAGKFFFGVPPFSNGSHMQTFTHTHACTHAHTHTHNWLFSDEEELMVKCFLSTSASEDSRSQTIHNFRYIHTVLTTQPGSVCVFVFVSTVQGAKTIQL